MTQNHSLTGLFLMLALIIFSAPELAVSKPVEDTNSSALSKGVPALNLSFVAFATGLNGPIEMRHASAGDPRLFVVEQAGRIRIVTETGSVNSTPFLDLSARVDSSANEEGLLGLAFHPDYPANGFFYVQYTHTNNGCRRTRISRFTVSEDMNIADAGSEDILLEVGQPASNHNAGGIYFGPQDGFLYIPMGDGGGSGDNAGFGDNAQNSGLLLGKIIRIDVDMNASSLPNCTDVALTSPSCSTADNNATGNYRIPDDNPFLLDANTCDETWASGLRNPYRSGFDPVTGDFFTGDVGQSTVEEIDFIAASSSGGENFGWRCYEGNLPYNTSGCGPASQYTDPIFASTRAANPNDRSIIGGRVYRGSIYPDMMGIYITADFYSGNVFALQPDGVGGWDSQQMNGIAGFGTAAISDAANGEIYFVNISGTLYHLQEDTLIDPVFADSFEGL